jgi:thiol-disulfide isomerase/thioredoxin
MNRFLLQCLVLLFAAFFLLSNSSAYSQTARPKSPPIKRTVAAAKPAIRITQIDDAALGKLLKPNGKPLLVNFWATWCDPCRDEFPDLVKIDGEYKGKIDFITITLDEPEDIKGAVPKFLSQMKAEMPAYLLVSKDESELITSIVKDWSGAMPFTILYNPKGEIAYVRQGKILPDLLKGVLDKLIEPTRAGN